MAYYIFVENNELTGCGQVRQLGEDVLNIEVSKAVYDEYASDPLKYVYSDGEIVVNPDYEEEKAEQHRANFESQFLLTSLGNYRLQPKGYANAQQSIDTVHNIVMASGGLTEQIAQMVIFYETPDFTKPEQCTEEWLVEHQTHPSPMTTQQWVAFYVEFTSLYAQKQYRLSIGEE